MPTILASTILGQARNILSDVTPVHWLDAELLSWLNQGQREIVILRPSAYTKLASVALAAGTRQSLPADAIVLLDVTRNMGLNGATPGSPVRQTTKQLLDTQQPSWHTDPAETEVEHYAYDLQQPRVFWVYPKANAQTAQVELSYSALPPDVPNVNSLISLDDIYAGPLLDYVLYRAFSKDTEHEGNLQRAALARAAFENSLGLKAQADAANSADGPSGQTK